MGLSSLLSGISAYFPEQLRFMLNEDIFLTIMLLMFFFMFHNILSLNKRFKRYENDTKGFFIRLKRKMKKQEKEPDG